MISLNSAAFARLNQRADDNRREIRELRITRPSLLDWRFTGDAYIVDAGDGDFALRLGDYDLTRISAVSLDLPCLNQILDRLWHRRPRRRW